MLQNNQSQSASKSASKMAFSRGRDVFEGLSSALICWFVGKELGIVDLIPFWRGATTTFFAAAGLGMILGLTRARMLLPVLVVMAVSGWLIVAFTPLVAICAKPLIVSQTPVKADAVVVLLASIQLDNDFGTPSLERTLHAIELSQPPLATRLILTQGSSDSGSHLIATSRLIANLKIQRSLEVVGPVFDTHDEAVQVSRLCREKNWKKILLVTSPIHSRRAMEVFSKTGLDVVSTPCRETSYDLENLNSPVARIRAFQDAIHEIVGLRIYRARGWI